MIMKYLIRFTLLLTLLLTTGACTHNDGDIGPLFGYWRLDKMTVNDTPHNLYDNTGVELYAFAFQSNVMYIQTMLPHLDYDRAFGTWSLDGDVMTWHFRWTDMNNYANYTDPEALMLDPSGLTTLHVLRLTSSHLDVEYTDTDGKVIRYYLTKTK